LQQHCDATAKSKFKIFERQQLTVNKQQATASDTSSNSISGVGLGMGNSADSNSDGSSEIKK